MSTEWIYTSDLEGQTPLDRAIKSNHMALCELLLKQESEDDAEMLKGILSPAQEFIALTVALKLEFGVALKSFRGREEIDLNGVVDDQIDWHLRVYPGWITTEAGERRAHGGQIYDRRDAGEVLHDHTCRLEGYIRTAFALRLPGSQILDILTSDFPLIYLTKD